MMTFTERLHQRMSVWWGVPGGWRNPWTWHRPVHRVVDRHRLRDRTWPLERWRCCDLWQRALHNKWNAREFAAMHAVPVPELYWHGRRIGDLPLRQLPEHFVLRPVWGSRGIGTHVITRGRDLLQERSYTDAELRAALRREHGAIARVPILAEEFMTTEEGDYRQGVEYKFYAFGDRVAAILQVEHRGRTILQRHYRADWTPFDDPMSTMRDLADPRPRPSRLDDLLDIARRLGGSYGTFVRVDLYLTAKGCYFGEFSSVPYEGHGFTPWADEYFGRFWDETCPDRT